MPLDNCLTPLRADTFALGTVPSAHAGGVIYVHSSATGINDRSNWADASTGIQLASLPAVAPVSAQKVSPSTEQSAANINQPSPSCTTESFDTVLPPNWASTNNSSPVGSRTWFTGDSSVFGAQSGGASSYIVVNYDSTGITGTISNWLVTPEWSISTGDTLTFYTRKAATSPEYPDRLQVRLSTNGASINVGGNQNSVGDFTTLLLDINPTLIRGVYP
jgi:hypothetical protein